MKFALVFCGRIAGGKTTTAEYVRSKYGVVGVSFGGYVRHLAKTYGFEETRDNLQNIGDLIRALIDERTFLQNTLDLYNIKSDDIVVFDGVRHVETLQAIRSLASTVAIYLEASPMVRYERYNSRGNLNLSFSEFMAIDEHHVESDIRNLKLICDEVWDVSKNSEAQVNVRIDAALEDYLMISHMDQMIFA